MLSLPAADPDGAAATLPARAHAAAEATPGRYKQTLQKNPTAAEGTRNKHSSAQQAVCLDAVAATDFSKGSPVA